MPSVPYGSDTGAFVISTHRPFPLAAVLGIAALIASPLAAQERAKDVRTPAPTVAVAVRAAPEAPTLDGHLDDPAWQGAPPITHFTQRDPHEGEPASEHTVARVLYTDKALYVGVRAYDRDPAGIRAQLTRRDQDSQSDWIGVAIDSYHDRRTAFFFLVNPAGVQRDVYLYDDNNEDDSWDAVWEVAVSQDDSGWTAEFRIPFSQLRFPDQHTLDFGFNILRVINRRHEEDHWRLLPKAQSGVVSKFGDLVGIKGVHPPRRLEVLPYVVADQFLTPAVAGNPFATGQRRSGTMGADVTYGLTSNITLTATINPDFGQVDADPAVVNLTAYETFYPERRPFFTEGLDIFRFNLGVGDGDGANETLFYTRRIGRAPQGAADARGGYVAPVGETPILGAAKLSGKTPGGWTVGLLGAETGTVGADVVDSLGMPHRDVVEPRTSYFVGRLAREWRGGQTRLGLFGTGVVRSLPANLTDLRRSAYTLGADWQYRFRHDTYALTGWIAASSVYGSRQAITATQMSSARYLQRPDRTYARLDSTRTSLAGLAGLAYLEKRGGGNWLFSVGLDSRSPGFEVNDLGYEQQTDTRSQWLWVQRRWLTPGTVFRSVRINFNQWTQWDYGWNRQNIGGNVNLHFQLLNYWGADFGYNHNAGGLQPDVLRGGPLFRRPANNNVWGGVYTDGRRALQGSVTGYYYRQTAGPTYGGGFNVELAWRPATNVDLDVSPGMDWNRDDWQYLTTADALGATHYVFGGLKQTTASATMRGNVTFTPKLSLQLYAQPYVTAGHYVDFKQVADPRATDYAQRFETFGTDRLIVDGGTVAVDLNRDGTPDIPLGTPDFRYLSFRSNVVLRWEYRSGSTLFVVWQHGQSTSGTDGRFALGNELGDLFRAPADNTFVVKLNYWLSL